MVLLLHSHFHIYPTLIPGRAPTYGYIKRALCGCDLEIWCCEFTTDRQPQKPISAYQARLSCSRHSMLELFSVR